MEVRSGFPSKQYREHQGVKDQHDEAREQPFDAAEHYD